MSTSEQNGQVLVPPVPSRPERPQAASERHRWIVVLLILGLASTLILTSFTGRAETFALLLNANLVFVAGIIAFQVLRYVAMTVSIRVIAAIVAVRAPFVELFEVVVAAQAANRTFIGGAAGLAIRLAFFVKRGMHSGTFVAVEGIEDAVSLVAVALLFLSGLGLVLVSGAGAGIRLDVIAAFIAGVIVLTAAVITLLRHRAWVERAADALARVVQATIGRLARRNWYSPERVQGGVADLYRAFALARRDPVRVLISFFCALGRLGCDWIALYFAFRAVGYDISPGAVLLIFIVSTSVATLAIVPGQIGVMETTLAVMATALGVPPPVAVGASLLYRLISFWLPIPFGYAFAWNLEKRGLL